MHVRTISSIAGLTALLMVGAGLGQANAAVAPVATATVKCVVKPPQVKPKAYFAWSGIKKN
jgi:hypothetical protein